MRIETEHRHPGTRYAVPDNSIVRVFLDGDEISALHFVHMADEELGFVAYEECEAKGVPPIWVAHQSIRPNRPQHANCGCSGRACPFRFYVSGPWP